MSATGQPDDSPDEPEPGREDEEDEAAYFGKALGAAEFEALRSRAVLGALQELSEL